MLKILIRKILEFFTKIKDFIFNFFNGNLKSGSSQNNDDLDSEARGASEEKTNPIESQPVKNFQQDNNKTTPEVQNLAKNNSSANLRSRSDKEKSPQNNTLNSLEAILNTPKATDNTTIKQQDSSVILSNPSNQNHSLQDSNNVNITLVSTSNQVSQNDNLNNNLSLVTRGESQEKTNPIESQPVKNFQQDNNKTTPEVQNLAENSSSANLKSRSDKEKSPQNNTLHYTSKATDNIAIKQQDSSVIPSDPSSQNHSLQDSNNVTTTFVSTSNNDNLNDNLSLVTRGESEENTHLTVKRQDHSSSKIKLNSEREVDSPVVQPNKSFLYDTHPTNNTPIRQEASSINDNNTTNIQNFFSKIFFSKIKETFQGLPTKLKDIKKTLETNSNIKSIDRRRQKKRENAVSSNPNGLQLDEPHMNNALENPIKEEPIGGNTSSARLKQSDVCHQLSKSKEVEVQSPLIPHEKQPESLDEDEKSTLRKEGYVIPRREEPLAPSTEVKDPTISTPQVFFESYLKLITFNQQ